MYHIYIILLDHIKFIFPNSKILFYLIIIAKMKILRIILIVSAISLIASKAEKAKATLSVKKDNFSENPIAGVAVPNDNYLLQQAEVNFYTYFNLFFLGIQKTYYDEHYSQIN